MTRVVAALEAQGLVARETSADDRRIVHIRATSRGAQLLHQGRQRRVASLERALASLPVRDRAALKRAVPILEAVVRGEPPRS